MNRSTPYPDTSRPKGKPWLPAEVAAHLSVTTKHVRFLMDTGKITFIRVGRRKRLVPDAEVRRVEREGV